MAGQPAQKLSWDAEGELAGVGSDTNGDGTVSDAEAADGDKYVYTADGERLIRHQTGEQGATTTVYLPGGQELVLDKGTGQTKATRYYAFGGKTIAMRIGMLQDQLITIVPDHHNTGQAQITNLTSTVTRKYTDPFGVERGATGAAGWSGDHAFLDKPLDATGLTAVGARMYDTALGRFLSVDPIMDLSDPQQWNAYSYANNNPTTMSDPDGLEPRPIHERGDGGESCAGFDYNNCGGGEAPSGPSDPGDQPPVDDPSLSGDCLSLECLGAGQVRMQEYYASEEYLRMELAASSVIPVVGVPAATVQGGWCAYDGDWLCSILSVMGVGLEGAGLVAGGLRLGASSAVAAKGALSITARAASASEIRAAEFMSAQGRSVVLRDPVEGAARGSGTSDLLVDGVQWDVYTPTSGSATNIIRAIAKKGSQVQGGGVVLDFSRTSVTADDLGDIMARVGNSTSRISDVVVLP
ncbi:RHS repeat-associated core domain-containing protein [Promicromonospora soli]